ncbi:MAG TPA: hypothetical protein VMB80_00995 [Candidatus Acidoferrum sp.]|nr:hypothetical protein [Candidatus Acidoferrum sp.]
MFVVLLVTDTKFEFAFLGPQDDRLAVHPAHHVEGRLGFAAQGQLQQVFLNARLDGLAQLGLDLEEAVGRAQSVNALVGPLVVVVFDPELDPFAGRLEALERGPDQKVLPDGGPEAFHLAQRHGMVGPGFEVSHTVFLQLGLEATGAPPGSVLAAIVSEHLLGRLILAGRHPVNLDDGLGRGAAEQVGADDVPRVIVHEGDEVGVAPAQPEGEDVGLPHLVGRGPLEKAGTHHVPLLVRPAFRHQPGFVQPAPHGLRTGRQEEPPAQHLTDALDAKAGIIGFEFPDFFGDGRRQLGRTRAGAGRCQARLPTQPILL